ncbi:MAG: ATP-dependent sacrificial sulfur transferase LarE [Caldiserica bacterium]|nr:ATP-dependent sacrificial sulfur transferase LarE [Caldisericota bacterium]
MNPEVKLEKLKKEIKKLGSLVVAFSGGVDSTFLLKVARDILGKENTLAVTAKSETYAQHEFEEAKRIAQKLDVNWMWIESKELALENFRKNPPDRCYYCKSELFRELKKIARERGFRHVVDGTNADDTNDFRPGMRAAEELRVLSPLKIAGITKEEIRMLSKAMGLPTWNKAAYACLASRFPYGEVINEEKLAKIQEAEEFLRRYKLRQMRVRFHGNIARLEVEPADFQKLIKVREELIAKFKQLGFNYITLDLEGYRTGSMNETLEK